jgi:hemoglobin-like flavoprotein
MRDEPELAVQQIRLLRDSLVALAPRDDELAQHFYAHLFRLDPSLRLLFRRDMTRQHHKWVTTLNAIFREVQEPQQLAVAAQQLGQRHHHYGVHREDYRLAGEALNAALEEVLAAEFTPELRAAWSAAYDYLAYLMLQPLERYESGL